MASLTGFAPVISCLRGRCVDWLHHRDKNGEGRRMGFPSLASQVPKRNVRFANCNRAFDLMHVKHPL